MCKRKQQRNRLPTNDDNNRWCPGDVIQKHVSVVTFIIVPGFGLAIVIVGAIYLYLSTAELIVPACLIVQGIILFIIGVEDTAISIYKKYIKVSLPLKTLGFIVTLATLVWLIAGNVWIFQILANGRDKLLSENGCTPTGLHFAILGIIVLDLSLLHIIYHVVYMMLKFLSCFFVWGTKILG